MEKKTFQFEIKSLDDATGIIEGYASTFGNVDLGGDVVEKGAFKKTLKEQKDVPILWQHYSDEVIGVTLDAKEDDYGLYVKGQINLDVQKGREAYSLIKMGAIKGFSIGYSTVKDLWDQGARHLKELKLFEWSPVTFPMNTAAVCTGVKSLPELDNAIERLIKAADEKPELAQQAINSINALITQEPSSGTPNVIEPQPSIKSLDLSHLMENVNALLKTGV